MKYLDLIVGVFSLALCGCQSQQQAVDQMQPNALEVAQKPGAFELDCPAATAQVLSKDNDVDRSANGALHAERAC